jgi:hypothetical protein
MWLVAATVIFGIGHVGIHVGHVKNIKQGGNAG